MLYLVVQQLVATSIKRLEAITTSQLAPREKLIEAVTAHVQYFDETYRTSTVMFVDRAHPYFSEEQQAAILEMYDRYESLLGRIIEEGIASGELRADLDPRIVTLGVLGMCNWVRRWYHQGGRYTAREIGAIFVQLLLDGLQRRGNGHQST